MEGLSSKSSSKILKNKKPPKLSHQVSNTVKSTYMSNDIESGDKEWPTLVSQNAHKFNNASQESNYVLQKTMDEKYENKSKTLTFKDAILSKPDIQKTKFYSSEPETKDAVETQKTKRKKRRRRKAKEKTDIFPNNLEVGLEISQFCLNTSEFPDLDTHPEQVLETKSKNQTISHSEPNEPNKSATPLKSDRKTNQPLIVSLVDIGSNEKTKKNEKLKCHKLDGKFSKTVGVSTNPLDSNPVNHRGKTRETPRPKKPSILKKTILKERTEKRLKKQSKDGVETLNDGLNSLEVKQDNMNDHPSSNEIDNQEKCESVSNDFLLTNSEIQNSSLTELTETKEVTEMKETREITEMAEAKKKIHSKKFREYCNQLIDPRINDVCMNLLQDIVRFQDNAYFKNPVKAKTKRRYVAGIREVTKHLKLNKLKCIILAPNCEKIESPGGLDEAINSIIKNAMEQSVPFLFALNRQVLGKGIKKKSPVSVVGIFDYAGADQYFHELVDLAQQAKLAYQEMTEKNEEFNFDR